MEKTGKWLRNFLGSNKKAEKENKRVQPTSVNENQSNPTPNPPKVKRGRSFRRSSANRDSNFQDPIAINPTRVLEEPSRLHKQHAMVVAVATAAAADAAVAAAQAAAAMIRLTSVVQNNFSAYEAAAIRIQAAFRSYLARKALCALRGLVKFQALVRGYLVRKQASTTIRCMQSLLMVQVRARAQRLGMSDLPHLAAVQRQSICRKSSLENPLYEIKRCIDEKVKLVEIDLGESKGSSKNRTSYSNPQSERSDPRFSSYYVAQRGQLTQDQSPISPAPSAISDHSRGTWSKYFEDYSFMTTTQSSPHYFSAGTEPIQQDHPFLFNQESQRLSRHYMANTESSRAKARSQSAPKLRLESCEKMTRINSRKPSIEGSNIPRSPQMQRSSSHLGIDYSLRDMLKIQ